MKNTTFHGVADGVLVVRGRGDARITAPDGQIAVMAAESNDGTPSVAIPFGRSDGKDPLGVMYLALDQAEAFAAGLTKAIADVRARKEGTAAPVVPS